MNTLKYLIFAAMFFFTATASAVTVRVVEGGTVGLDDAGYFAGIVTLDIDGIQYQAMMTDIDYMVENPTWYIDYVTPWESNVYFQADILAGVTTLYTPEEYSMAASFFLDGMLGYVTSDPLWTASFNEMVGEIITGSVGLISTLAYADRVYDEASGLTLGDVFDSTVAAGLDPNYDYSEFMFILDGNQAPNMLVFGSAISSVPVPAAVWLLGSGLLGLVGVAARKRNLLLVH